MKTGGISIHLNEEMVEAMRSRGQKATACAITETICRWHSMMMAGEKELAASFTAQEIDEAVCMIATQAKLDRLTHKELWGLSAERLAAIVGIQAESLGERMVRLGELAAAALKERVGGVIVLPPGTGGRPKGK